MSGTISKSDTRPFSHSDGSRETPTPTPCCAFFRASSTSRQNHNLIVKHNLVVCSSCTRVRGWPSQLSRQLSSCSDKRCVCVCVPVCLESEGFICACVFSCDCCVCACLFVCLFLSVSLASMLCPRSTIFFFPRTCTESSACIMRSPGAQVKSTRRTRRAGSRKGAC